MKNSYFVSFSGAVQRFEARSAYETGEARRRLLYFFLQYNQCKTVTTTFITPIHITSSLNKKRKESTINKFWCQF